jgi:glycerophosphoryl diester phosphodiesterase
MAEKLLTPWAYPSIFAHRGGGALAPENTLAAIRKGQSLGFSAHEFDVKLSKDRVALLLHDATLERTTNGQGRATDLDWSELRRLDAGAWHSPEYRGEPLAAFEDAAKLLRSQETLANVEIKPTPGEERETGIAVAEAAALLWDDAPVPPLLSSFSFEALMAARDAAPHLPRGWLTKEFTPADGARLQALKAVSLHTDHRKLDLARIPELHAKGYRVMLYTVNDVATARTLLDAGADGLFTDNLTEFAQAFPRLI